MHAAAGSRRITLGWACRRLGTTVDASRQESTCAQFAAEWRRSAGALTDALTSTDGRWAVVSTSLTAIIAGAVAWLAIGTLPPGAALGVNRHSRTLLPYQ